MLARLSTGVARFLDVHIETLPSLPENEEDSLVVDFDSLRHLILPTYPWDYVTRVCDKSVVPVYQNIHALLRNDFETVTRVLSELEHYDDDENPLPICKIENTTPVNNLRNDLCKTAATFERIIGSTLRKRPRRKRRSSSDIFVNPIVIPSPHPDAPTIIITPCPYQIRETSCRIPCQDSAFGNLLTVHNHQTYNHVHPPMVPPCCPLPMINEWVWRDGHWAAILPSLAEQSNQGIHARVLSLKKKTTKLEQRT